MSDRPSAADAELVRVMTRAAERVLAHDRAYDVATQATGEMVNGPVVLEARHGDTAYVLWASISDLVDAPEGPYSDEACTTAAEVAASEWLAVVTGSPESIASYFKRWFPGSGSTGSGSAWTELNARWARRPPRRNPDTSAPGSGLGYEVPTIKRVDRVPGA